MTERLQGHPVPAEAVPGTVQGQEGLNTNETYMVECKIGPRH